MMFPLFNREKERAINLGVAKWPARPALLFQKTVWSAKLKWTRKYTPSCFKGRLARAKWAEPAKIKKKFNFKKKLEKNNLPDGSARPRQLSRTKKATPPCQKMVDWTHFDTPT